MFLVSITPAAELLGFPGEGMHGKMNYMDREGGMLIKPTENETSSPGSTY